MNNATGESAHQGWTSSPDQRGTIDILWTCISTLFICVWTSLHLNVPAKDGSVLVWLQKLKWAIIAAAAPEIVTLYACQQFLLAYIQSINMRRLGYDKWTIIHSFAVIMGAIRIDRFEEPGHAFNAVHIEYFAKLAEGPESILMRKPPGSSSVLMENAAEEGTAERKAAERKAESDLKEEIRDKSKSDSLGKAIACLQAAWLILQCIGRKVQHLPITTLEIATIAYVANAFLVYLLWWHKPLDIEVPILIKVPEVELEEQSFLGQCKDRIRNWQGIQDIGGNEILSNEDGIQSNALTAYERHPPTSYEQIVEWVEGTSRGPCTLSKGEKIMFSFYSSFVVRPNGLDRAVSFFISASIATVFGAIHLIAWNNYFASWVEKLLWRICAATTTGLPIVFLIWYISLGLLFRARFKPTSASFIRQYITYTPLLFYIICRLYLIVEPFAGLRYMPVGAFHTVNWAYFIPHIF